jgi:zinc protease
MKPAALFRFARNTVLPLAATFALAGCATPAAVAPQVAAAPASNLTALVDQVQIPFETFTLPNGLTTIVHTDRKAPIVGVTVYYRVGSKHEPRGRTGFAHLFEHLMFGGSENVPNFDIPLEAAGSTPTNGSTYFDRTNYVETVPTGALDLALFMESDRMGHLLGAVTQEKLDTQRGVVQNEKRQGDNQPYGLTDYLFAEGLLPVGHPYRHATIGSMADLNAASLADVQDWFTDNYGPNNVVLALTGDIDAATARPIVERWFGAIPRGPDVRQVQAGPVNLNAPVERIVTDQVPLTAIFRNWTGPGLNDPDAIPLQVGMHILGGLQSSRLDNALVRGQQLAVSVSAYASAHEQLSYLQAQVNVSDGVSREAAQAAMEAEIARLIAEGPTADELSRAQTQLVAGTIGALESVGGFGGKGTILAEGLMYSGRADFYRAQLEQMAALTPADVQGALQRWLSRPAFTLIVVPGERTMNGDEMGGWGDESDVALTEADETAPTSVSRTAPPREAPPIAPVGELAFPAVERATLSNGLRVVLARRTSVPMVSLALTVDAGSVVDAPDAAGTHQTMVDLLTEGTTSRSAEDIAVAQEQLGSSLSASAGVDRDTVGLTTLAINLAPSLTLMADVVRNPAFRTEDVERVRDQRVAGIAEELSQPAGLAQRAFMPLIYGSAHPYSHASNAGNAEVIGALDPARLAEEHSAWFRPDLASITAVGDVTMPELVAALEASFGGWQAPAGAAPAKAVGQPAPSPARRLVVVDRPNSPSSYLMMGRTTPLSGYTPGMEAIDLASQVVGDGFLSRLNADLRESKGWTYGVRAAIPGAAGQRALVVQTQVQADRTADSVRVILDQLTAFPASRPVDEVELQRVTEGNVRGLPNRFETNAQVLGALLANQLYGRDDRYQARLPELYRAVDAAAIDTAARSYLQPNDFTIVVVGDRKVIEPQVGALGMQAEYVAADGL